MRWPIYLIGFGVWIFVTPASLLRAEPTPQEQYLNIYVAIHTAGELEKRGDYRGALDGFKDCYTKLQKIHLDNPDWETAMVTARLRDFKEKITDLQPKVDAMAPEPAPTPPTPPEPNPGANNPAANVSPSPTDPTASLQQQLADLKQKLEDMTAKYQDSRTEVQTLRAQLKTVTEQLAAANSQQSMDNSMGKLLAENKALSDKLADAQKQLEQIKSPQAMTLLRAKLKNTEDNLAVAQANNQALQQTTNTLKAQLDQAQTDLTEANQKLASTSVTSPEYATIKHENETMRGILTREIQEQAHRDMAKRLYQEEFDNLKIKSKVLQEKVDILATPMTAPANDAERVLLASLKVPGMEAPSNVLTATNTPPVSPSPDDSTNTPPVTVMGDTNNPTPPSGDTNAPPLTSTNSTNMDAGTTGTAPATDTNTAPNPAPPDMGDKTVSNIPGATTVIKDTKIVQNDNSKQPDFTQYANHPRLPDDMRDTAQQAADFFKAQRYDEASDKYQVIIDKYPESLYAWSNLGVVRFQQGKLNEALRALQQAVKLSPTDAFSYMNLGIVYYQLNQYESAIDALQRALALDPNNAKAHNYLGCACSQKGWQEVAEKEFRKAIDIDETFGDAHFNLALVYATSKPPSLELARRHYNRAVELGISKDARLEKLLQP